MERSDERKKAKWELSGGEHRDNVSEFFSTLSAKSTLTKCCSVCMHGWIKRESLFFCKTSNNISSQQINRNEFLIQFRWKSSTLPLAPSPAPKHHIALSLFSSSKLFSYRLLVCSLNRAGVASVCVRFFLVLLLWARFVKMFKSK